MKKTNSKSSYRKSISAKTERSKSEESSLREFFIDQLKDIYWAEKHLTKVLPKMEKAATTGDMKQIFTNHLAETEEHVTRLEKVFDLLEERTQSKKCEAIEGITKEGETIIDSTEEGSLTRDVGLIFAAQKVEHYEIATYGGLVQLARTLRENEVATLLEEILQEEKGADEALTSLAMGRINEEAFTEEEELESAGE